MIPDTSAWTPIGQSGNADFFEIEPGVLAVVPFDGWTRAANNAFAGIKRVYMELDGSLK